MEVDGEGAEDEQICRYCFEGKEDGDLISPCKCSGGQKYVHLKCLRQWQRMVLVSQPTHPAFYDRDLRHQTCNVCKAEFACAPPERHELMASFTGPEIAAHINAGRIIAASEAFSIELDRQLETMHPITRHRSSYDNWIRGVYLITSVEEADGFQKLPISDNRTLEMVRARLGSGLTLSANGQQFCLAAAGSLEGIAKDNLAEALALLTAPCELVLTPETPPTCGDDHVIAVNLTRPVDPPPEPAVMERYKHSVSSKYKGAAKVQVTHFIGGPCEESDIMCCIVLGGSGKGWTVVKDVRQAWELAYSRAVKRHENQGDIVGGMTVRLTGLQAAPELNGELGLTLRFNEAAGRWLVRLRNGEGKQLRPANLEALDGHTGRLFVFWGDARWSRAQLLGEIAKGDWGLCHANVGDLAAAPHERWSQTAGRIAFAPITDMTEPYMREAAQREMVVAQRQVQMHGQAQGDGEEAEDELRERTASSFSEP